MKIIDGKDLAGLKFIQQEDGTLKIYAGKSKFIPKEGELYYYIDATTIDHRRCNNHSSLDQWRIKHQPVFRTKEDAEDYLLFLKQLDKYTYNFTSEEWKNKNISKHFIFYYDGVKTTFLSDYIKYPSVPYFKSNEDAHDFISEAGKDRIKKYLFDIWED